MSIVTLTDIADPVRFDPGMYPVLLSVLIEMPGKLEVRTPVEAVSFREKGSMKIFV